MGRIHKIIVYSLFGSGIMVYAMEDDFSSKNSGPQVCFKRTVYDFYQDTGLFILAYFGLAPSNWRDYCGLSNKWAIAAASMDREENEE